MTKLRREKKLIPRFEKGLGDKGRRRFNTRSTVGSHQSETQTWVLSSVSIQDTLYALYTIQHQEPHPKYYKYYIVLNFILYPPLCVKKCKIMPKNHVKSRAISNFSQILPILTNAKITSLYFCFMYAAFGNHFILNSFQLLNWVGKMVNTGA